MSRVNNFDKNLGIVLKQIRTQRKLSMQNIADRMGITRQAYFYYEKGVVALSVSQLIRICNIINANYVEVIKEAEELMRAKV